MTSNVKYDPDKGLMVVHVSMKFHRHGGRKAIIAPTENCEAPLEPQEELVMALARAHRWQSKLDSGEFKSLRELAAAVNRDTSYVGRILGLTLLAPDIIEAILDGREPDGLSLKKLTCQSLPLLWEEQRKKFGF